MEPEFDDCLDHGGIRAAQLNKWVFEVAWEVANKGTGSPAAKIRQVNSL
jgi:hypothetical protein